ncbi:MAG: tRNA (guanosine(37)-N1)-methyltransferase TrmD [Proteobacteria bacterium]|nr:tRNA (guanosine(37)-N1)-methyltransferase TrmD [Pseudomonadota bacterium]
MRFDVITLFPEFIDHCARIGVVGRARERGLLDVACWNPRDYAGGNYRRVDERPFGGGPGMLMMIEPLRECLAAARAAAVMPGDTPAPLIHLSPQGEKLTQAMVRKLASQPRLLLLCGRYEGIDERLIESEVDAEVSIGDFVLSGGELAAAVLIDAVGRLQHGALNDEQSAVQDSFEGGLLDCPHYTRSESLGTAGVPDVLLSGDHAAIARWRRQQALGRTWLRRPDLLARTTLCDDDRALLAAFSREWLRARAVPTSK